MSPAGKCIPVPLHRCTCKVNWRRLLSREHASRVKKSRRPKVTHDAFDTHLFSCSSSCIMYTLNLRMTCSPIDRPKTSSSFLGLKTDSSDMRLSTTPIGCCAYIGVGQNGKLLGGAGRGGTAGLTVGRPRVTMGAYCDHILSSQLRTWVVYVLLGRYCWSRTSRLIDVTTSSAFATRSPGRIRCAIKGTVAAAATAAIAAVEDVLQ